MHLLVILIYFTSSGFASTCIKTRAAFDIGSGSTKMKVAKVDTCQQIIVEELYEEKIKVDYQEDLLNHASQFSIDIMDQGIEALRDLKNKAIQKGATQLSGVATQAFREASNSPEFEKRIKQELDIPVRSISQKQEAKLVFAGVVERTKRSPKKLVVWDIGGGSMQLTRYRGSQRWSIYQGKVASESFKRSVIRTIKKLESASTPNPMKMSEVIRAIDLAEEIALKEIRRKKISPALLKRLKGAQIIGVGGVHYYAVHQAIENSSHEYDGKYSVDQIIDMMTTKTNLTDEALGGERRYASSQLTNPILVAGFMKALKIHSVEALQIDNTNGLLLSSRYWESEK